MLGPLGVVPSHQRCGAGTALVREGLERLEKRGVRQVFVLGDPAYYGRFGFRAERDVKTPCSIPDKWADAWQSLTLGADGRLPDGSLQVLRPWRDAALWR